MTKRACVNPGHSGSDSGNYKWGIEEEDTNYSICWHMAAALERCGVTPVWTRGRETKFASKDAELAHIRSVANTCDILLAVHNDSGPADARGMSVLYKSAADKALAAAVYPLLRVLTPWTDRGLIYRDDLYVLNNITPPTALFETDFNSNRAAHALMLNLAWRVKVGEAIAKGACAYLKVPWVPARPAAPTVTEPALTLAISKHNAHPREGYVLTGVLKPSFAGASVVITYRRPGEKLWRKWVTLKTNANGTYSVGTRGYRLGIYTYRATFPGDATHGVAHYAYATIGILR